MSNSICSILDCDKRLVARGWCSRHYMLWKRHGDANYRLPGEIRNAHRICPWCHIDLPLSDFTVNSAYCRSCVASKKRAKPLPAIIRNSPAYCVECGVQFIPTRRTDICCSKRCSSSRVARFMRQDTLKYRALRKSAFVESVDPKAVLERDGWVCQLCGEPIDRLAKYPARRSQSIDHILPLHHGGLHEYENCQAAHLSCNASKGARMT